ncbi:branched-chain amino acid ABC transporter permease [Streptomyces sp. NPDC018693]|uniref:branched-chain amino acid ABC transporter permease n=1 Tax=unclassified Streptomyces TaxID=2593676 RepID=UPI0037A7C7B3
MEQILLFAVLGLGQGALIAGIALGVVATYRGSGIINLSTGAVAMVAGYVFWALSTGFFGFSLPTAAALAGALMAALAVGVVTEVAVFKPLRAVSPLAKLAASLGILLTLQATVLLVFGTQPQQAPSILPSDAVTVLGVTTPVDRFLLTGLVIAVALALGALYRWTRFGLATRAASENEQAALLAGLSPNSVSLANTLLSALIAGLLGVLAAPIVQVDSVTLPLQVVPALAAALFAGFTSLWIACSAGILIGVLQSVVYYLSTQSWFPTDNGNAMPGLQQLLIFILMIIALYVKGAGLPRRGEVVEQRLPAVPLPDRLLRPAVLATAAAALALVVLPFDFRQALTNSLIGAIIVLSYVVITGYVGQISVMQLALSGTAGFVLSHLATGLRIPFPFSALGATLLATLLGVAAGISALRVRGVSLAVVTLAAALAMEQALFTNTSFGGTAGVTVPPPRLFGVDLGPGAAFRGLDGNEPSPLFGFLVLSVAVALGLYVANLRRTGLGRRMLAVRSNERAAAAAGVNVRGVKIAAFGISSFIASAAGTLYAYNFGSVSAARFTALAALGLIGFAYIGGITMVSGAVIAGLMSTEAFIPHALDKWFGIKGTWALLFAGVSLIVTLIANPDGIAGANHRRRKARTAARTAKAAQATLAVDAAPDTAGATTAPAPEEVAR